MFWPPAWKPPSARMRCCSGMFVLMPSTTISASALRMRAIAVSRFSRTTGIDWVVVPRGPKTTFQAVNLAFPLLAIAASKRLPAKTVAALP